jgi:hypothetical protein
VARLGFIFCNGDDVKNCVLYEICVALCLFVSFLAFVVKWLEVGERQRIGGDGEEGDGTRACEWPSFWLRMHMKSWRMRRVW